MKTPKKSLTAFLLLLTLSGACFAQEAQNEELRKRIGLGFSLFGPGQFASLDLNYFINNSLNAEVGLGLPMKYGGIKYHFGSGHFKKNPYIGLQVTYGEYITQLGVGGSSTMKPGWGIYLPIGTPGGVGNPNFSFNVEIALWHHFVEKKTIVFGGFKFKFYPF